MRCHLVQGDGEALFVVSCQGTRETIKNYDRYFHLDITEELKRQTESARSHNIDSEEVMGMFSAAQQRAPNATLHFLSSRIHSKKNFVTVYLDSLQEERRDKVISFAVSFTRKLRIRKRTEKRNVLAELSRRSSQKRQKKKMSELGKIEKKLRAFPSATTDLLSVAFPELKRNKLQELTDILDGKCIGRNIMPSWHDDATQENTLYCGLIEKLLRGGMKLLTGNRRRIMTMPRITNSPSMLSQQICSWMTWPLCNLHSIGK